MTKMQKIIPHLWFDKEAKEAARFYTSLFGGSKIKNITTIHDTPSGDADMVTIELSGMEFMLISAGPYFKINNSVSFLVYCDTKKETDALWANLSAGGKVLMAFGSYPFSEKYGWTEDRYGLSWQVMYSGESRKSRKIIPVLMFSDKVSGKCEDALNFYTSVFKNSKIHNIYRYEDGEEPDRKGTIKHASFKLEDMELAAMDTARVHGIAFNEAVSLIVRCNNQEEIDYYWGKLSAVPESEQCGWLKDRYGLS